MAHWICVGVRYGRSRHTEHRMGRCPILGRYCLVRLLFDVLGFWCSGNRRNASIGERAVGLARHYFKTVDCREDWNFDFLLGNGCVGLWWPLLVGFPLHGSHHRIWQVTRLTHASVESWFTLTVIVHQLACDGKKCIEFGIVKLWRSRPTQSTARRTIRCTGAAKSGGLEMDNLSSPPRDR